MNDFSAAIYPLGHIAERRLASFAEAHTATGAVGDDLADLPTPAETAHLDGCVRCRSLLVGHERTLTLLTGAWSVQQVPMPATSGATRVGLGRTLTPASARSRGQRQGASIFVIAVVVLLVGLVGFGAATLTARCNSAARRVCDGTLIAAQQGLDLSKVPADCRIASDPNGAVASSSTTATGGRTIRSARRIRLAGDVGHQMQARPNLVRTSTVRRAAASLGREGRRLRRERISPGNACSARLVTEGD
jgi:hypothetical protein